MKTDSAGIMFTQFVDIAEPLEVFALRPFDKERLGCAAFLVDDLRQHCP